MLCFEEPWVKPSCAWMCLQPWVASRLPYQLSWPLPSAEEQMMSRVSQWNLLCLHPLLLRYQMRHAFWFGRACASQMHLSSSVVGSCAV